jgi:hypothetical protein
MPSKWQKERRFITRKLSRFTERRQKLPAIVLGSSAKSELFRRVTLPADHKEFMPTDGKPALTPEEIALLKWWIEEGKGAENLSFTAVPHHEKMTAVASGMLGIAGAVLPQETHPYKLLSILIYRRR